MSDYTMADFRAEMKRRGVDDRKRFFPSKQARAAHKERQRTKYSKPEYQPKPRSEPREESARLFRRRTLGATRRRIAHLDGLLMLGHFVTPCPRAGWFSKCSSSCVCFGTGEAYVDDLIARYRAVLNELEAFSK